MEAFENMEENLTVEDTRRLYETLQEQGVPLVDNATGLDLNAEVRKKRILALSAHGDIVWRMCQYPLEWMIEQGDQDVQARAIATRAYWGNNQSWIIDWCNDYLYFILCELAMRDTKAFRKALTVLPPEASAIDVTVRRLALMFAEDMTKPAGLKFKRIGGGGKRHKHKK